MDEQVDKEKELCVGPMNYHWNREIEFPENSRPTMIRRKSITEAIGKLIVAFKSIPFNRKFFRRMKL